MSKRENNANNIFRPSDSPLTEYEKEQIVLRKNLERLKAERLAREAASSRKD
jgi:U3 small nucleolar ribonucleoprotein component